MLNYPLKFKPIYKERIWGGQRLRTFLGKNLPSDGRWGESWEISAVPGDVSVVDNGVFAGKNLQELLQTYGEQLVGKSVYKHYGNEFPLLVKFLDANDVLSIQVHPDDQLAMQRHNCLGKTEMWYIIDAEPDAELIVGLKKGTDKQTYIETFRQGKLRDILNNVKVKAGESWLLNAGTTHAIGAGVLLMEIQQSSDITYRIYDWDRVDDKGNARQLHVEQALDAIKFDAGHDARNVPVTTMNQSVMLASCKYFTTNILHFDKSITKDYTNTDSFIIYGCTKGSFDVITHGNESFTIQIGETVLIPASVKHLQLLPHGSSSVVESYVGN